jgi:hypothetical protein
MPLLHSTVLAQSTPVLAVLPSGAVADGGVLAQGAAEGSEGRWAHMSI